MNNLLKPKVKVYRKALSEQEVYEQERFYLLEVEDHTGQIERAGGEKFIDSLFQGMQCCKLSTVLSREIDCNYYDASVKIVQRGERDVVGRVVITKRQIPLKIKELKDKIISKILDL